MNLRITALELAQAHKLDHTATARLMSLAGLDTQPAPLARWFWRAVAILAAALGGLGLIFWVAANWGDFGRAGRFALLQAFVVVMLLGAWWRPALRAPLALLALLGTGGLFAYFGQTYQTGADPWQLFALWAVLTLPLALAVRSDVVWAPWAIVVMTAISLWMQTHMGHQWNIRTEHLFVHMAAWAAALTLSVGLSTLLSGITGAGVWSWRTATMLFISMVTLTALGGLFARHVSAHYVLGLVVLAAAGAMFASARMYDVFALSGVALGLNVLVLGGVGRLLFEGARSDIIGALLLMGLVSAGVLAASVNVILRIVRARTPGDARATPVEDAA
ncbi:DUF2157 domain-containing protein [Variovorax sp. VNK109]|uniref:DUF2157 domain-containing protein n=1 Tax=Variovorax sp. VNK109 TaxID=3400919 RepID=UPI003C0092E2